MIIKFEEEFSDMIDEDTSLLRTNGDKEMLEDNLNDIKQIKSFITSLLQKQEEETRLEVMYEIAVKNAIRYANDKQKELMNKNDELAQKS